MFQSHGKRMGIGVISTLCETLDYAIYGSHVMQMLILIFRVVMPCGLLGRRVKDRSSMFLRTAGIYLPIHEAL
jgi:hypothetical protein